MTKKDAVHLYARHNLPNYCGNIYDSYDEMMSDGMCPHYSNLEPQLPIMAKTGEVLADVVQVTVHMKGTESIVAMRDSIIIANQMELPSGKIIRSFHQHDYVSETEDGVEYMVDGGTHYKRHSINGKDCSIYSNGPFLVVREYMMWGSGNWKGSGNRHTPLYKLSTQHIVNILDTVLNLGSEYKRLFNEELDYRQLVDIYIDDDGTISKGTDHA